MCSCCCRIHWVMKLKIPLDWTKFWHSSLVWDASVFVRIPQIPAPGSLSCSSSPEKALWLHRSDICQTIALFSNVHLNFSFKFKSKHLFWPICQSPLIEAVYLFCWAVGTAGRAFQLCKWAAVKKAERTWNRTVGTRPPPRHTKQPAVNWSCRAGSLSVCTCPCAGWHNDWLFCLWLAV